MYQRRPRRFRRTQNGRNRQLGGDMQRMRFNSFSNGHVKSRFNSSQSAEKLFEKYNTLAKEALTSGDKTLSENYFQHADHFMRIIEDKNRNQNQNKFNVVDKSIENKKNLSDNVEINQDKELKVEINQDKELKNKD